MSWVAMLPLIGAGAGAVKSIRDEETAKKQYDENAIRARYAPWTGQPLLNVQRPDMFNSVLQGAMSGLSMGQNIDQTLAMQDLQSQYNDAAIRRMDAESDLLESKLDQTTPAATPATTTPTGKKVSSAWEAMLARSYV